MDAGSRKGTKGQTRDCDDGILSYYMQYKLTCGTMTADKNYHVTQPPLDNLDVKRQKEVHWHNMSAHSYYCTPELYTPGREINE